MKFFKIIVLCVLLGLQNSVLFGLETPEMEQLPGIGLTTINNNQNLEITSEQKQLLKIIYL